MAFASSPTIGPDGTLFVPLLGSIDVAGLTTQEAAARLAERLADGYLVAPQVSVEVKEYLSQKVAIVGAVHRPGEYFLDGPTHLLEVLARAGNIDADKSAREIRIRRADGTTVVVATHDVHLLKKVPDSLIMRLDRGRLSDPTGALRYPPRREAPKESVGAP